MGLLENQCRVQPCSLTPASHNHSTAPLHALAGKSQQLLPLDTLPQSPRTRIRTDTTTTTSITTHTASTASQRLLATTRATPLVVQPPVDMSYLEALFLVSRTLTSTWCMTKGLLQHDGGCRPPEMIRHAVWPQVRATQAMARRARSINACNRQRRPLHVRHPLQSSY